MNKIKELAIYSGIGACLIGSTLKLTPATSRLQMVPNIESEVNHCDGYIYQKEVYENGVWVNDGYVTFSTKEDRNSTTVKYTYLRAIDDCFNEQESNKIKTLKI